LTSAHRYGAIPLLLVLALVGVLAAEAAELADEPVRVGVAAQTATSDNGQRKLVAMSDGSLELIYGQLDENTTQIFVTSSADNGRTWSDPVRLSRPGIPARLGSLVEDGTGRLHAAWVDYETVGHVWYSARDAGVWSEASKISPGTTYAGFPAISAESGRIHLLWYSSVPDEGYDIGARYELVHIANEDGEWGRPSVLSVGALDALNPTIARDRSGVVHAAWYERDIGRYQAHYTFLEDGEWRVPTEISPDTSDALGVAMEVGPDGTVHLVWEQFTDAGPEVRYTALTDQGWSPALTLAANPAVDPVLATDDDGRLFAAWSDREQVFATELDGSSWLPPTNLGPGTNPALAFGELIHIAWTRPAGEGYEVVVASLRSSVGGTTGWVTRALWAGIGLLATFGVLVLRRRGLRRLPSARREP